MEQRQTGADTAPQIEVTNLQRRFAHTEAVAGISFCVQRGEIFGLLGPNGAGKTTTLRLLTGQLVPHAGWAHVAGCDSVRDLQRLKERVGVVPEELNLYERLSARQNLHVNCWLYHLPEQRAEEVLELVHLRERARQPVRTFSQGMKQRLMIARALLHRPAVLFLDEPGRGLDPLAAREVRLAIESLRQEGTTIVLTTHLLSEADQLCQRVAFLNQGRIVASGTPHHLKQAYGRRTLLIRLFEQSGKTEGQSTPSAITLSLDDPADHSRLACLLAQGLVQSIHSQEASLEEVFIAVAGVRPADV